MMWKSLASYLKGTIWELILASLVALLRPAVTEIHASIDATTISRLNPSSLFLALCAAMAGCLILGTLFYEARSKRRKLRKYEIDPLFPELLRNKRRHEERVCPSCLFSDGIEYKEIITKIDKI